MDIQKVGVLGVASWALALRKLSCLAGVSEAGARRRNPERSEGSLEAMND